MILNNLNSFLNYLTISKIVCNNGSEFVLI